jgi:hypothetical protein
MATQQERRLMAWVSLKLWAEDEEKRIHNCIVEALRRLIDSQCVSSSDGELLISGKLRPFLYRVRKEMKLSWGLQSEAASFREIDDPKPIGHPDFRFSGNTPEYEIYDYDIECKLVRVVRKGKSWDYCEHYVTDGVRRFQERKYAQSSPPMGAMIGYVQEGDILVLLELVNDNVEKQGLKKIRLNDPINSRDVSLLAQHLRRDNDDFVLSHMWADLRKLLR